MDALGDVIEYLADADLPLHVREGAEIDIKYNGYLQLQQRQSLAATSEAR